MDVQAIASWNQVVLIWLSNEWASVRAADESMRHLIDDPHLDDDTEDSQRLRLLMSERAPIIDALLLPDSPLVRWVQIQEADLPQLYVIPSSEWFPLTAGTFLLVNAFPNMPSDERARIELWKDTLRNYDASQKIHVPILISADEAGPYVIIDGNHRAIALHELHMEEPNMPWHAMLITDRRIAHSLWYIGSTCARLNISNMNMMRVIQAIQGA